MGHVTNNEVVRSYFAAMERGDEEEAASFWAPDAINHGAGRPGQEPPRGSDGLRRVFGSLRAAFPDRRWQIEEMVAEGDRVAARVTVRGTYGEIPPVPVEGAMFITRAPTGKPYAVQHVHLFRIVDGQIVEHRAMRDDLGLLLQLGVLAPPASREETVSHESANKDLVRRHYEVIFNQKQTARLAETVSPDLVLHHGNVTLQPGLNEIRQHQESMFTGLPDLHYEVEEMLADGDKVATRVTISGTHLGEYWGFPPTGKRVSMKANQIARIAGGKIVELWGESDVAGMREQLQANSREVEPARTTGAHAQPRGAATSEPRGNAPGDPGGLD